MAKKIVAYIFLILLSAGATILGIYLLNGACGKFDDYYRLEDTAVSVKAKITRVVEDESSDDTDYKAYVSYIYNDKVYKNIYYKTYSSKPDHTEPLTVEIDPDNPSHLRPLNNGITQIIVGSLFIAFSLMALTHYAKNEFAMWKSRADFNTLYKSRYLTNKVVRGALDFESKCKNQAALFFSGVFSLMLLGFGAFFGIKNQSNSTVAVFLIILVIYITKQVFSYFSLKKHMEEFTIVSDTLDDIIHEDDGDGGTIIKWKFYNFGKWRPDNRLIVSQEGNEHDVYPKGANFYLVLSKQNPKKLLMLYDANSFTMQSQ